MGQIASLFGVAEPVFRRIEAQPETFAYASDSFAVEGFSQTFEGLRYTLAKLAEPAVKGLVAQLFEPEKYVGEMPNYEDIDWEKESDDFLFEVKVLPYHDPQAVARLSAFLDQITEQDFILSFGAAELNEQQVYPGGSWNESLEKDNHFSKQNMGREFLNLKKFFSQLASKNAYCLALIN